MDDQSSSTRKAGFCISPLISFEICLAPYPDCIYRNRFNNLKSEHWKGGGGYSVKSLVFTNILW
jgi:hypothetical protein